MNLKQQQNKLKTHLDPKTQIRSNNQKSGPTIVVVPNIHCHGLALKYISEKVWKLGEPEMLISVNGGAADINLNAETSEKVFQGLMESADSMKVWFLSGGTNSGVMQLLGKAKSSLAPSAPLIGFAAWGSIKDNERLLSSGIVADNSKVGGSLRVEIEQHHSHLFLVDDGTDSITGSHRARATFEKALRNRERLDNQRENKGSTDEQTVHRTRGMVKIPYVCVCIEGGVGCISQVYEVAKEGMVVLCIKGTGRASDFLSDLTLLRFDDQNDDRYIPWKYKTQQHRLLCEFMNQIDRERGGKSSKARSLVHDEPLKDFLFLYFSLNPDVKWVLCTFACMFVYGAEYCMYMTQIWALDPDRLHGNEHVGTIQAHVPEGARVDRRTIQTD